MIFTSYSPKFSYMLCGKTTHDPLGIQTSNENTGWKSLGRHGRHFVLLCLIPAGWTYQCSIANFHPLQISCETHWRGFPWVGLVDRLRGWGKLYRYGKPRRMPNDLSMVDFPYLRLTVGCPNCITLLCFFSCCRTVNPHFRLFDH